MDKVSSYNKNDSDSYWKLKTAILFLFLILFVENIITHELSAVKALVNQIISINQLENLQNRSNNDYIKGDIQDTIQRCLKPSST